MALTTDQARTLNEVQRILGFHQGYRYFAPGPYRKAAEKLVLIKAAHRHPSEEGMYRLGKA